MRTVPSNTQPTSHKCKTTSHQNDTIQHMPAMRINRHTGTQTACGEGQLIWNHAKTILAGMLRTSPAHIPEDWLLRLHFNIWPLKRNRAVLWTLAKVIIFGFQQLTTPTLKDFMDFLLRSRWKLMNTRRGRDLV